MCAPERRARAAAGAWRTAAREAPGGLYFRRFPDFRRFPATSAASRPAARGSVSGSSQLVPGRPLGMETGFWRPQPEGRLEVLLAHPTGITEIYLGEVTGTKIEMATDVVARTASAKEVTAGHRLYGLVGPDLAYAYDMAAVGQPLQPHLSAQLKRTAAA